MPKTVISVSVKSWSADDVDMFADKVSQYCKKREVASELIEEDNLNDSIQSFLNAERVDARITGHWRLLGIAYKPDGVTARVFFQRWVIMPDSEGKVNVIKWTKE